MTSERVPSQYAVPFVAGIIERRHAGRLQLLLQTRWQDHPRAFYNGTLEFAAGTLDLPYEDVHDALAREIREETGLVLRQVLGDARTRVFSPNGDDAVVGFRPFCCTQQLRGGRPWIGFVFRCLVEDGEPVAQVGETRDVTWVDVDQVRHLIATAPARFFPLELPALEYWLREIPS